MEVPLHISLSWWPMIDLGVVVDESEILALFLGVFRHFSTSLSRDARKQVTVNSTAGKNMVEPHIWRALRCAVQQPGDNSREAPTWYARHPGRPLVYLARR